MLCCSIWELLPFSVLTRETCGLGLGLAKMVLLTSLLCSVYNFDFVQQYDNVGMLYWLNTFNAVVKHATSSVTATVQYNVPSHEPTSSLFRHQSVGELARQPQPGNAHVVNCSNDSSYLQDGVVTVLRWGGQNYKLLKHVPLGCFVTNVIKIGWDFTELFKE